MSLIKRKPRSARPAIEPNVDSLEVAPLAPVPAIPAESVFPDEAPSVSIVAAGRPDDGIPPLDFSLSDDEKQEFVRLLNSAMPLRDRAAQLAKLASFSDTKRAAVGLRAIQEINALTGISAERTTEDAPLFVLPPGARVNVLVAKVEK